MKLQTPHKQRVALHSPKTALGWLILAKAVYGGLSSNPGLFPKPNPPLAQLKTDIDSFDAAESAVQQTHATGTAAARDAKLVIVRDDLHNVVEYVQSLVNADPANAANLAQAAGLALRKSKTVSKSELSAKPNKTMSGSVDLVAKLGSKVKTSHEWQYSTDGGKTWTSAQTTLQAKTTVTGLTPATTVLFRHRPITKSGPGAWSQAVTLIVS